MSKYLPWNSNDFIIPDIVQLLLAHNAPVKVKNLNGWTPLAEAVSYGDRITSKFISRFFSLQKINCNCYFKIIVTDGFLLLVT